METKDNNMNENRNKALNCLRFMTNFDNLEFYTPSYPQNRLQFFIANLSLPILSLKMEAKRHRKYGTFLQKTKIS